MARKVDRILHLVTSRRAMLVGMLFFTCVGAVFSAQRAVAHHSSAPFELTREVAIEGTVIRMEWTNPHTWIRLEVPDEKGNVVEWGVEATNPLSLSRMGWTANTFRPGDHVTITINPAQNGKPFGKFVSAILADGATLKLRGGAEDSAGADNSK